MSRFLFENFPKGTGFPPLPVPAHAGAAAGRRAGVLDRRCHHHRDRRRVLGRDAGRRHGAGRHPHRRARPGHPRATTRSTRSRAQRMSTVYMPGDKITMLPDDVVEAYTLAEGKTCPALSLYATLDPDDWSVLSHRDPRRAVPIAATCATTISTSWSPRKPWQPAPATIRTRTSSPCCGNGRRCWKQGRMAKRESFRPEAGADQPRRLQFLCRGRRRHHRAPQARRAAGQDRGRADDLRQQHLGQAAARRMACPASTAARAAAAAAGPPRCRCAWSRTPRRTRAWASTSTHGAPRRCGAIPTWSTSGRSWPASSTA